MKTNETGLSLINKNDRRNRTIIAAVLAFIIAAAFGLAFAFFPPDAMEAMSPEAQEPEAVLEANDPAPAAVAEAPAKAKKPKEPKADEGDGMDDGAETKAAAPGSRAEAEARARRNIDMNTLSLYFGENDWNFLGVMTLRFLLNIFFVWVLIAKIFLKGHRIREYSFCFFVSNILIFMVTSLLASVRVRTGFAFGLFAVLSILRYRTEQIQIREMTFLFASIILGVINSLATADQTIFAVLWANVILCMFVYICDQILIGDTDQILLVYDNTKLLGKGMEKELYEDIKNRFGYDAVRVVIVEMNYLTDSAKVKLVYKRA